MVTLAQQYDKIYTEKPGKWSNLTRDNLAFATLDGYLGQLPEYLLDVGCGNGHTLKYFAQHLKDTMLFGVDLSSVAIQLAKVSVPDAFVFAVPLLDYYPIEKFDVILAMGVMEHFELLPDNLQKLRSLLADDGVVYVEVPDNLAYSVSKVEGFYGQGMQQEWHLRRKTWEKILVDNGFTIAKAIRGPSKVFEFIWILTTAPIKAGAPN